MNSRCAAVVGALSRLVSVSRRSRVKAVFLLATAVSFEASAGVVAPPLAPGAEYQLVFTTRGGAIAFSNWMSTYNGLVREAAALNPLLPSTTWWVVASTGGSARSNAVVYADTPIYNTAGELVAANGDDFYSGSHVSSMGYDQFGDPQVSQVWTGMHADGSPRDYLSAVLPSTTYGYSTQLDQGWASFGTSYNRMEPRAYYGLSERLVAVPEPSTYAIALIGVACGGYSLFRRRKRD